MIFFLWYRKTVAVVERYQSIIVGVSTILSPSNVLLNDTLHYPVITDRVAVISIYLLCLNSLPVSCNAVLSACGLNLAEMMGLRTYNSMAFGLIEIKHLLWVQCHKKLFLKITRQTCK